MAFFLWQINLGNAESFSGFLPRSGIKKFHPIILSKNYQNKSSFLQRFRDGRISA